MSLTAQAFEIVRKLGYWLYLPDGYEKDEATRWPLILFLHGGGERGDDLELVKKHGIPKLAAQGQAFPFVVVSPQCPAASWWPAEVPQLRALLEDVLARYRVDPARVYLTGMSMGGYGSWSWAARQPEPFAAIAPMCGGYGEPLHWMVDALKDRPVWVFHGAQDPVVPLTESARLVEALRHAGAGENVRLTVYPDAGHDCWTESYANPALYEWFLQHRKDRA